MLIRRLLAAALLAALPFAARAQLAYSPVANDGTTGTVVGKLAKFTSAGAAITLLTSDTTWMGLVVGETVSTASPALTGNAILAIHGPANCIYDGTTVIGHYVAISSTVAGDCHDTGAATYPTSGAVVGIALAVNSGTGTTASTYLIPPGVQASSGGTFEITGHYDVGLTAAGTLNCYPIGSAYPGCFNGFDNDREAIVSAPRTFGAIAGVTGSGFYVQTTGTPGTGNNWVITVWIGGSGGALSAITCTIANAASSCSDTTHSATITAGNFYTIHFVASASAGTINTASWSLTAQ